MKPESTDNRWQGVLIDKHLRATAVTSADTLVDLAANSGVDYNEAEIALGDSGKVQLLEENVETLVTAAFSTIFSQMPIMPIMLVARQRALLQLPDLLAIDPTGRLTVIELKKTNAKGVEIISQTNEYLVQSAQKGFRQLARVFKEYYRLFPVFQPSYHAALLLRRRVESTPGLGPHFRKTDRFPEQQKLSAIGGDIYANRLSEISRHWLRDHGIDPEESIRNVLTQVRGRPDFAGTDLDSAFGETFGYGPVSKSAIGEMLNRRWKIVYFAPGFWFQRSAGGTDSVAAMLANMYYRGMELTFIEYRVVCRGKDGPPWLLAWAETDEWLKSAVDLGSAVAWKAAEPQFDEFTVALAHKGIAVRKTAGRYASWEVLEPDIADVRFEWPAGGDMGKLTSVYICFNNGALKENQPSELFAYLSSMHEDLQFRALHRRLEVSWDSTGNSVLVRDGVARVASRVVAAVLKWFARNQEPRPGDTGAALGKGG